MSEAKRSRRLTITAFISALAILLLGGCAANGGFTPTVTSVPATIGVASAPTPAPTETVNPSAPVAVSVILTDYRISSFTNQYELGKTYLFTVTNNGAVAHGFTIEANGATTNQPLSANGKSATIASVDPGKSLTLEWTFTSAGTVQLASHLNQDYEKGMVKTGITVH